MGVADAGGVAIDYRGAVDFVVMRPTRSRVVECIVKWVLARGGSMPSSGYMAPRTFASLCLDYSATAGVNDTLVYAAGVPIECYEGVEGRLTLIAEHKESMVFDWFDPLDSSSS